MGLAVGLKVTGVGGLVGLAVGLKVTGVGGLVGLAVGLAVGGSVGEATGVEVCMAVQLISSTRVRVLGPASGPGPLSYVAQTWTKLDPGERTNVTVDQDGTSNGQTILNQLTW